MKLFQYLRSTTRSEIIASMRSPKDSFGRLASHLSEVDGLTDPATEHNTEQSLSVDRPKVYLANPMRKRIAKTTGASIEMTKTMMKKGRAALKKTPATTTNSPTDSKSDSPAPAPLHAG